MQNQTGWDQAPFDDLDGLKRYVAENAGVATVPMRWVRDAFDHGRLGSRVRADISRKLVWDGIGHLPMLMPDDQELPVRLYDKRSPAGQFIDMLLEPDQRNDRPIAERLVSQEADIIDQIRVLVCGGS